MSERIKADPLGGIGGNDLQKCSLAMAFLDEHLYPMGEAALPVSDPYRGETYLFDPYEKVDPRVHSSMVVALCAAADLVALTFDASRRSIVDRLAKFEKEIG